ncbi:MAG TPA: hypothetical protein VMG10_08315, partial [Gemmataceae bacterium]|nr:hypothetical protein [Gemmataceae bacterium]
MPSLGANAMAGRTAHPWFYAAKNAWYVKVGNKKVALGVSGEENKADALKAWHKLMADGPKPTPEPKAVPTVKAVMDAFLADAESRVQPITIQFYRKFCLPFSADYGTLRADALTLASVEAWTRKPAWSQSSRHDALGVLATAFRWAERAGMLSRSPLVGIRKPPKASRGAKALISAEEHF